MSHSGNHGGENSSPRLATRADERGKLRVFLGYAAGVGTTLAMLEAARRRKAQGADVVVAWLGAHGRPEAGPLLEEFEFLPPRVFRDGDVTGAELALDLALSRRPRLALVDDLAHANAPDSRHRRRYQDVQELLEAGIDVYATLNVQNLESVQDVVARITGASVGETIPDRVLDEADEIELVDLEPQELLDRRASSPDQPAESFFTPEKLSALRALAMRRVADRVDEQMRAQMGMASVRGPWPVTERLLVCVGPSPSSTRLVRACRRLAQGLHAPWIAFSVETPTLSQEDRMRVSNTLQLAESLGGEVVRLPGNSIPELAVEYARLRNVTKIIVGKPVGEKWWKTWLARPIVDDIIRVSGDIDVYVITGLEETEKPLSLRPAAAHRARRLDHIKALGIVGAVTLLGELVDRWLANTNLVMLYLLVVVVAALRWGRAPAVLAAAASVLAFNFFFVPPRYTLIVNDSQYLLTFAGLLLVGLIISDQASRLRSQVRRGQRIQLQTLAAYGLSRQLAEAADRQQVVDALIRQLEQTFTYHVTVLFPSGDIMEAHPSSTRPWASGEEQSVALWVMRNRLPAGIGTDTLPSLPDLFLPLLSGERALGVLRLRLEQAPEEDERHQLEALTRLTAIVLERVDLAEEARRTQLLEETEKLRTSLLNSLSHDLQTPIASAMGSLDSLWDPQLDLDADTRKMLLETARDQLRRLHRLVSDLLDLSRLASGSPALKREPCEVADLVGSALDRLEGATEELELAVPGDLPLVRVDFALMTTVLVNLLENALKYARKIRLSASCSNDKVRVQVADRGPGIPPEELDRIFEPFFRLKRPGDPAGTGLGLAICRGLVEAHGGRIWAERREGGGCIVTVELERDAE